MNKLPIVSLTTDFGQKDGYVGAMQGVILSICPTATITTLTHEIPAQNIPAAAFVLYQAFDLYPAHTVHCVVVDPGVGSERRAIAIATTHGIFVGPDNGVFSLILTTDEVDILETATLSNPVYQRPSVSATFHGRDIFAPAAAHIAQGVPVSEFGPTVTDPVQLDFLTKTGATAQKGTSRIIHIDHFGNLFLDIRADEINDPQQVVFTVGGRKIESLRNTFADVDQGQPLAYVGSTRDHIEIAIRNGHAARALGVQLGDVVRVSGGQ